MTPTRLVRLTAVLLSSLFAALLAMQGRGLPETQLFGMVFGALMSLSLTVLVLRAKTFQGAARAFIAVLAVAVIGSIAAAATRSRLGDVVGLVGSVVATLICASQAVSNLRAPIPDDSVVSKKSVAAFHNFAETLRRDVADALQALSEASDFSEPFVLERLTALRGKVRYAEQWSTRMQLPMSDPGRRQLNSIKRRLDRA